MIRILLVLSLLVVVARADELTKSVQGLLKEQGFYYGEVSGASGPETASAVKRYQIRNGLEVTGTLTKETLEALGLVGDSQPLVPVEPPSRPVETEPEP
ncbi:MAG: peptidoglycan-binding domain-containing protein, partial [Chthoniobacteraceae bacterium]